MCLVTIDPLAYVPLLFFAATLSFIGKSVLVLSFMPIYRGGLGDVFFFFFVRSSMHSSSVGWESWGGGAHEIFHAR